MRSGWTELHNQGAVWKYNMRAHWNDRHPNTPMPTVRETTYDFLHEQAEQKRGVRDPPALRLFVVRVVRVERAEGRCVENRMFGLFGLFVSNEEAVVFISPHLNLQP